MKASGWRRNVRCARSTAGTREDAALPWADGIRAVRWLSLRGCAQCDRHHGFHVGLSREDPPEACTNNLVIVCEEDSDFSRGGNHLRAALGYWIPRKRHSAAPSDPEEPSHGMQQKPHETPDQRAVDPDELEILADCIFNPGNELFGFP
jgi:hypothetical protein